MAKTGEAQTSGMSEIRGIDIDKLAKGFADEDIVFKKFVSNATTSARELRWYQKRSGFLELTSPASVENVGHGALPFTLEQSWTRQTSYIRKYFVESPVISMEDIKDSDIDILAGNLRDLVRAVAYKVDGRIWDVITESRTPTSINLTSCSGASWELGASSNPILDIMDAKQKIRSYGYDPEGGSLLLNSVSHKLLLTWLIDTKGSSIPSFSSEKVKSGVVMEILGLNVSVSENCTAKFGVVGQLQRAATWKSFAPITARTIEEVGIGTKIRVWEEGECILHDPRAITLLSGCGVA